MARYCKSCGTKETILIRLNSNSLCSDCANASQSSQASNIIVKCLRNESVRIAGNAIVISQKSQETTIPIQNIQEFNLTPPHNYFHGSISIKTAKVADASLRIGGGLTVSSNSITLLLADNFQFTIAKRMQEFISSYSTTSVVATSSPADEIMKYKQLLDAGVITPEEFDTKKKQLLNL